jgi:hypothetical protein
VDHNVDIGGVEIGIGEGGTPGSQRQISVEEAAVRPAPFARGAELVVQASLEDAEVFDDPFRLEGPPVGADGV